MKNSRTYPVKEYLKKSEHPEAIKKMMMDLYNGKSKTMEEWKNIDDDINGRRC